LENVVGAGRPIEWTDEVKAAVVEEICLEIAMGFSLKSILANDDSLPSYSSFMTWISASKEFLEKYQVAIDIRTEIRAEEITDIADEDPRTYIDANGAVRIDPAFIAMQKNRMDARKWEASKLKPKKYGEKLNVEATGKDGAPLPPAVVQVYLPSNGRD
jgi:hypothetical protein